MLFRSFSDSKKSQIVSLSVVVAFFYIFVSHFSGFQYPQFSWMYSAGNLRLVVQDLIGASLGIVLLIAYNGQKGLSKTKWLFYGYYPLHLLLIYAISANL